MRCWTYDVYEYWVEHGPGTKFMISHVHSRQERAILSPRSFGNHGNEYDGYSYELKFKAR